MITTCALKELHATTCLDLGWPTAYQTLGARTRNRNWEHRQLEGNKNLVRNQTKHYTTRMINEFTCATKNARACIREEQLFDTRLTNIVRKNGYHGIYNSKEFRINLDDLKTVDIRIIWL